MLGVAGACRREELVNITTKDIEILNKSSALIKIPKTKTNIQRSFTISDDFFNIFEKYRALRPANATTNRFFLNYRNGKCTQQVIGINKFGSMPKEIATYLNLPDPKSYTGHTFRRTSATLLAEAGADVTVLKRHGGWKSNAIAEGYVEQSTENKRKIEAQITQSVQIQPSTSEDRTSSTEHVYKSSLVPAKKIKYSEPANEEEIISGLVSQNSYM